MIFKDGYNCLVVEFFFYYVECVKYLEMNVFDKMKYEIIRYFFFSDFKRNCFILFMKFLRVGFYFDGSLDFVKCY